jgi:plasmid stabilization system protein ParE
MVEGVWTEPALSDLDAVADYIALENPDAARALVQRVFYREDSRGVLILCVMRAERLLRPEMLGFREEDET